MSDEQKPNFENLELNRETVQDLTEGEGEQARGGVAGALVQADFNKGTKNMDCTGPCPGL